MTRDEFQKLAREESQKYVKSMGEPMSLLVSALIRTGYHEGASFGFDQALKAQCEDLRRFNRNAVDNGDRWEAECLKADAKVRALEALEAAARNHGDADWIANVIDALTELDRVRTGNEIRKE